MARLILLRILETYFRHRWLYLLPLVLMIAAAAAYFLTKNPVYSAEGVMYVQTDTLLSSLTSVRQNDYSWVSPAQATSAEIGELLQTDAFVRSIIHQTQLEIEMNQGSVMVDDIIEGVRKIVWTSPLGNNQVLVKAEHEDPTVAYELVNSLIDSYLFWRVNTDVEDSLVAISFLTELMGTYESELESARNRLQSYLEAHPEPLRGERSPTEQLEIQRLQAAVDLASTRYASVLDKQENAKLTLAQTESEVRQSYYLIDSPQVPTEPELSKREIAMNLAIFLGMGVILSSVCIAGAVLLDRSIRFPIDVYHGLHLPVLAVVPRVDPIGTPAKQAMKAETDVRTVMEHGRENIASEHVIT